MSPSKLYTIPFGRPFLPELAAFLKREVDPTTLPFTLLILPTKQACLSFKKAFCALKKGATSFLPQIVPLAELQTHAPLLPLWWELPPTLSPWVQWGLFKKISEVYLKQNPEIASSPFELALEIQNVFEELMRAEKPQLHAPDTFFSSSKTFSLLKLLMAYMPAIEQEENAITAAQKQVLFFNRILAHWEQTPPSYPIICAGSTGSHPHTQKLMASILKLPQGRIVLPGWPFYQPSSPSDSPARSVPSKLLPTHPCYTQNLLLKELEASVTDVPAEIPPSLAKGYREKIAQGFVQLGLQAPSALFAETIPSIPLEESADISFIPCNSSLEEASVIAFIIRYHLQTDIKSQITVVTPDLSLQRKITAELLQWGIVPSLSSGIPLPQSPLGGFFILLSTFLTTPCVADFLALLQHPLFNLLADSQKTHHTHVAFFQLALRKASPLLLTQLSSEMSLSLFIETLFACVKDASSLESWAPMIHSIFAVPENSAYSLEERLDTYHNLLQTILLPTIWDTEEGKKLLTLFQNLKEASHAFGPLDQAAIHHLLKLALEKTTFYATPNQSRVALLGTLEARLCFSEIVIIASLNEKTWPAPLLPDPWLPPEIREYNGLPPLERKIGLSGHDFLSLLGAPTLYLTRAIKEDGIETAPSRWWQNLEILLPSASSASPFPWQKWQQEWQKGSLSKGGFPLSCESPTWQPPCPPLTCRPTKFSVTALELLKRDPYGYYARYILKLLPLPPLAPTLEEILSPAERGKRLHKCIEHFVNQQPPSAIFSDNALKTFLVIGKNVFQDIYTQPIVKHFWEPRFQKIAAWLLKEWKDLALGAQWVSEVEGSMTVAIPGLSNPVIVQAIADHLIQLEDGLSIIDYKTGQLPTFQDVEEGFSPQLPLEAWMAQQGSFQKSIGASLENISLSFWQLSGGEPAGEIKMLKKIPDLLDKTQNNLIELLECYLVEGKPYCPCPVPKEKPAYNPYELLERLSAATVTQ